MSVRLITDSEHHTCDSCDAEHFGTLPEIAAMGWRRNKVASGFFVMCGACVQHYEQRWAAA